MSEKAYLGFWGQLKRPILALAPLANVTDAAYRQIIAKYGKPDVMFTEFVSCDGLCSKGREKLMIALRYTEGERPICAQFFGADPKNFTECAKLASELGFDGIDINMGCPDKTVCKNGEGAALIKDPTLAQEIISATKEGAGKLPVSVKTRIGYNTKNVDSWVTALLIQKPAVITLHGRTKKEMSKVNADWNAIGQAVDIAKGSGTLIIGNGDVKNIDQAIEYADKYGVDGVMFGRAIFGNPWFFNPLVSAVEGDLKARMRVMIEHAKLFETLFGDQKTFLTMRKHFNSYGAGFQGAKDLRVLLNQTECTDDVVRIVRDFFKRMDEHSSDNQLSTN